MNAASVVYQSLVYVFVRTGNYAVSENSSNNFLHVDFCTTSSITIHWCVSLKIGKTLASCSFDKYGLILIIFGILANSISRLSNMMCLFNFPCPFTFTYFICFFNSTDGNNAKRNVSTCFLMVSVAVSKLGCIILFFAETADTTVKFCWRADWCYQFFSALHCWQRVCVSAEQRTCSPRTRGTVQILRRETDLIVHKRQFYCFTLCTIIKRILYRIVVAASDSSVVRS